MTDMTLREQLDAARRDAKEAEAYADEMEKVAGDHLIAAMDLITSTLAIKAKLTKVIGGAETVLEAWDHHTRDAVVPTALHDAVEELRADVAEAKGDKP